MLKVKCFVCNPLQENCYVVSDESGECVIIDCGAYYEHEKDALFNYIRDERLKPVALLATHGHLDHNFGVSDVFGKYGLKVMICSEDQAMVEHLNEQARDIFGLELNIGCPGTEHLLENGEKICFGTSSLKVLKTPGHTHGSCLFCSEQENIVFTGDTLFRMSIGRTDFAEGSWQEMQHSLSNVIANLPSEMVVYSGHGPRTTIADELQYNPYLR